VALFFDGEALGEQDRDSPNRPVLVGRASFGRDASSDDLSIRRCGRQGGGRGEGERTGQPEPAVKGARVSVGGPADSPRG